MENEKPTEEELNAWLEKVHFGSCCSDPIDSPTVQTEKERSDK
ncbi:MAG: hypothetical protein ACI9IJ_002426 [Psychromonas sp.]|jgi:hypothetical protein